MGAVILSDVLELRYKSAQMGKPRPNQVGLSSAALDKPRHR